MDSRISVVKDKDGNIVEYRVGNLLFKTQLDAEIL